MLAFARTSLGSDVYGVVPETKECKSGRNYIAFNYIIKSELTVMIEDVLYTVLNIDADVKYYW